jgi:hypothetical protein
VRPPLRTTVLALALPVAVALFAVAAQTACEGAQPPRVGSSFAGLPSGAATAT